MNLEKYMIPCPSKYFLGMECFGCGTQRALVLVFEGHFMDAFKMFPAIYSLITFLIFAAVNFIDKKHNYGPILIGLAIINSVIMVVSFAFKQTYLLK